MSLYLSDRSHEGRGRENNRFPHARRHGLSQCAAAQLHEPAVLRFRLCRARRPDLRQSAVDPRADVERSVSVGRVYENAGRQGRQGSLTAAPGRHQDEGSACRRTLAFSHVQRELARPPVAIRAAAGRALALETLAIAIRNGAEVAAELSAVRIFARAAEGAVVVAVAPFIVASDVAVQAAGVRIEGIALVVAVDVAAERVPEQAAQNDAAGDCAAVTVARRATDQSTGDRAEDRAG